MCMDIKILIGKRVKELRNNLGISQEALADLANLDRTYITSVECGHRNISITNIEKLAVALKVSLKEFFNFFLRAVNRKFFALLKPMNNRDRIFYGRMIHTRIFVKRTNSGKHSIAAGWHMCVHKLHQKMFHG